MAINFEPNKQNPYATPDCQIPNSKATASTSLWWSLLTGILSSTISAPLIGGGIALIFRFPIPFVGYKSGIEWVFPAMLSTIFYGVVMGGFAVTIGIGILWGFVAERYSVSFERSKRFKIIGCSILTTFLLLSILSVLDKIIGEW